MICFPPLCSPWGCKDALSPASALELCWQLFLQPREEKESEERCGPAAGQLLPCQGKGIQASERREGGGDAAPAMWAELSSPPWVGLSAQGALGEGPEPKPDVLT